MHIEFLDLLRCPVAHEDSWLVAAVTRMDERTVVEAKLGCPVCGAGYFVRDGVALFAGEPPVKSGSGPQAVNVQRDDETDDSMRVAAFLDLTRPGAIALLAGDWAPTSRAVSGLTGARIFSLNAPGADGEFANVAELRAENRIPVADRSLDGVALDIAHSPPGMVNEAARLLRPRGRLIAAANAQLPPQFRELARDADIVVAEWVGELIALRR